MEIASFFQYVLRPLPVPFSTRLKGMSLVLWIEINQRFKKGMQPFQGNHVLIKRGY
jgi:hypothetical protein